MSVHLKKIENDEDLSPAFNYFDKDQNGFIEFDELREVLLEDNLGPNNEQIIRDILTDVDLDKVNQSFSNSLFYLYSISGYNQTQIN